MLPPPFPIRESADYNWTVRGLDGQPLLMSQLRGRVVFLNFWATWCVPCIAEMPSIQRLYEQVKDDAVFVCVSPEEATLVDRFVEEKGYRIPMYTFEGSPPAVFRIKSYPKTLIIAPDGRIAFAHTGTAVWDDPSSVEFIRNLSSSAATRGP
jgi:thiol-disulfide isomerase/thioredoxin